MAAKHMIQVLHTGGELRSSVTLHGAVLSSLFVLCIPLALPADEPTTASTIEGQVFTSDDKGTHPLVGVHVAALPYERSEEDTAGVDEEDPEIPLSAMTDQDGCFTLQIPATWGLVALWLDDDAYAIERPVLVGRGRQDTRVQLTAMRSGAIAGVVLDEASVAPVQNAWVQVTPRFPHDETGPEQIWADSCVTTHTRTAEDGSFQVPIRGFNEADFLVHSLRHSPFHVRMPVPPSGTEAPLRVALVAGCNVIGRLCYPDEFADAERLRVDLERVDHKKTFGPISFVNEGLRLHLSTESGAFSVEHLLPGEYRLRIDDPTRSLASPSHIQFVVPRDAAQLDLGDRLIPLGAMIRGLVTMPDLSVAGEEWSVTADLLGPGGVVEARYDSPVASNGLYRLTGLPPGNYSLTARNRSDGRSASQRIEVLSREREITVDILLK